MTELHLCLLTSSSPKMVHFSTTTRQSSKTLKHISNFRHMIDLIKISKTAQKLEVIHLLKIPY